MASFRRESERLGVRHSTQLEAIKSALQKLADRREEGLAASSAATELSTLQRMMSRVQLSEREITKEFAIVRSLGFKSRTVRHDSIPSAHKETFQWAVRTKPNPSSETAMSNTDPGGNKPNLLEWFKHGDGAFWVSGKPGSGKSTFMKFIADHLVSRSALSQWAHPLQVVVASHYFWSCGTEMQRSLQGLLQTLLYDIFRHCPDLIRVICQSRWEAQQEERQQPWTLPELRSVLGALSAQTQIPCKFCFFIDGLDEFDGEHIDFCENMTAMMNSPNIKLCVSSRPWNVFEDAFGQEKQRKIYIHELTRADILRYAQDRLHRHPRWKLFGLQAARANLLVESIADKAQGVFLWVSIVTKLLREGLTNDDTLSDLRKRLESFPSDLEPFFKQIVESVRDFYRAKMAEALRMALSAPEPLDAIIYSFHDEEEGDDGNGDDAFAWGLLGREECDAEAMKSRREQVTRRLNGRCRGLLELNFMGQIGFLHRTVADFLRTREMSDFLCANTASDFSPNLAIFKAYASWVKAAGLEDSDFSLESVGGGADSHLETQLAYSIKKALGYAARAELEPFEHKHSIDSTIDEMDYDVSALISSRLPSSSENPTFGLGLPRMFRELVLELPLMAYLSRKLPRDPAYFFGFTRPGLSVVLHHPDPPPNTWPFQIAEKLTCLLHCAHSPNQHIPGTGLTVWTEFLSETMVEGQYPVWYPDIVMGARFLSALTTGLFGVFLEHGADPNASLAPLSSPFERLVVLAFDIPMQKEYETGYLEVLDRFVSHGLGFSPYVDDAGQPLSLQGPRRRHPCIQFFERLKRDLENQSPYRARFRMDVSRRILPLAQLAKWPLDKHQSLLDETLLSFPGCETKDPADRVSEARGGRDKTSGKRRLVDDQDERRLRRCQER